ncbi:MAG: hypothetical protein ABI268_05205 [Rhodanobacter sp.]
MKQTTSVRRQSGLVLLRRSNLEPIHVDCAATQTRGVVGEAV